MSDERGFLAAGAIPDALKGLLKLWAQRLFLGEWYVSKLAHSHYVFAHPPEISFEDSARLGLVDIGRNGNGFLREGRKLLTALNALVNNAGRGKVHLVRVQICRIYCIFA